MLDSCRITIGLVFIRHKPVSSFWVLRFRDLGVFVFDLGCFVFEIWVLLASVFVFECFVFETTAKTVHQYGVFVQSSTKEREMFRRITVGHKDLRLGQIFYILVFYNISFSWLLPPDGFQFIFLLRDSENDL